IGRDILLFALAGGFPPLDAYPPGQRGAIEEMRARMNLTPPPAPQTNGRARA
ncbi:MAG TPA: hypothetical protein GX686_05040, partial [Paracoccus sp.]|nr:hypothetical protein [Paracoccus sp. (in: a-proteobacteria)]